MSRSTAPDSPASIVWTEEEKRYLRAMLRLDFLESSATSELRRALTMRRPNGGTGPASPQNHIRNNDSKPPAGEFRVLVIGAKGTGKTSILTRVFYIFPPALHLFSPTEEPLSHRQPDIANLSSLLSSPARSAKAVFPIPMNRTIHFTTKAAGTSPKSTAKTTPSTPSKCPPNTSGATT